jgi:hypothetical protein
MDTGSTGWPAFAPTHSICSLIWRGCTSPQAGRLRCLAGRFELARDVLRCAQLEGEDSGSSWSCLCSSEIHCRRLADLILPAIHDGAQASQPGAKEAGVAEFVDFMVFRDSALQVLFRQGLQWLDHASNPAPSFLSLTAEEQNAILERVAYKVKYRDGKQAGQQFFQLIRRYTVMGFYTTGS